MNIPDKWSWVDLSNPQFSHALEMILDSSENLTIMGCAGTGKSLLIRMAADMLKGNTIILSSTGISAANLVSEDITASTIHSFFRLGPHSIFSEYASLKPELTDVMCNIDTLIIDEISMVTSNLLDTLIRHLSLYRKLKVQPVPRMILLGDVLQLPPVIQKDDEVERYYDEHYSGHVMFFASKSYQKLHFNVINLSMIYRQKDVSFQGILNRFRVGAPTKEDLDIINERVCDEQRFCKTHEYMMYLATTNRAVDSINEFYMDYDDAKAYHGIIEGGYSMKDSPQLSESVELAVGMQVMCLRNNKKAGYQNGTIGRVVSLSDDCVEIRTREGKHLFVVHESWSQYRYEVSSEGKVLAIPSGKFTQIGCKPAFACTIHKSQGLTLDSVYIDFSGFSLADGLVYMALSRCRTLEGIGLKSPIKAGKVKACQEALDFLKSKEEAYEDSMHERLASVEPEAPMPF